MPSYAAALAADPSNRFAVYKQGAARAYYQQLALMHKVYLRALRRRARERYRDTL